MNAPVLAVDGPAASSPAAVATSPTIRRPPMRWRCCSCDRRTRMQGDRGDRQGRTHAAMPGVVAIGTAERHRRRTGLVTCLRSARSRTPRAIAIESRRTCRCRSAGCAMSARSSPWWSPARSTSTRRRRGAGRRLRSLSAVVTVAQALAPGAPLLHDDAPGNLMPLEQGRCLGDGCRSRRPRTSTTLSIRSPRQIVHYMETRAAWSAYDPADDVVTVYLSPAGRADPAPA